MEIKAEYPQGQRHIEMTLVKMLSEKRSWNDIREIHTALWNIRSHAKSMKEEQKKLCPDKITESTSK